MASRSHWTHLTKPLSIVLYNLRSASTIPLQNVVLKPWLISRRLDDACMIALIDLFKADTTESDTYMSLQRDVLCKKWLEKQLVEHCGFPADITTMA
jgi:hypothetical protein